MVLNIRTSSLLATLLFTAIIFLATNAEADGPGEAFLPLGFYGGLSPNEESGWVNFTYTEDSSGEYYCTVTDTTAEYDLEDYAYYLLDSTGTTSEFGEIAMQNLSGNVVGIDVTYDATCGDNCYDDLQTRSDAIDADSGATYAVTFNDNDHDGKLTAGDEFTVRGSGNSYDGPAQDDWSLEIVYQPTGLIAGVTMTDYTDDYFVMVGEAQYDQGSFFRSNREATYTGTWVYTATGLTTFSLKSFQIWFEGTDEDYDADCEWTIYLLSNGVDISEHVFGCQSNGDNLVKEEYSFDDNNTVILETGQTFEVELWYEGWEDVNIYAGSATYDTGITVQLFGWMVVDNPVSTSATDVTDHSANHSVISYTEMFGTSVDLSINAYTEFYDDNLSYDWSSDVDGYLGNDSSITATNLSAGLHVITVTVSGEVCECSEQRTLQLDVTAPPTAYAGDSVVVYANVIVQFNGQGSDVDGTIVKWEWDFDANGIYDWSSDANGVTTFIFNTPGNYSVELQVTDDDGFTASATRDVTVVAIVIPEFPSSNETGNETGNETSDNGGDGETTGSGLPGFGAAGSMAALATAGVVASFRRRKLLR